MKLSKGDSVIVLTGKDKGKKGTVLRVLRAENRVVVGGVNMVTKHVKKTVQNAGSTVKFERSIHASNVAILDPKTGKPTRIGYKNEGGKKIRIAKKSGVALERTKTAEKETSASAPTAKPAAAPAKKSFWGGKKVKSSEGAEAETRAEGSQKVITHVRSAGRGS